MDENNLKSKKDMAENLYDITKQLFRCPICGSGMDVNSDCLKCENNHTFNISKKGLVLLQRKTRYYESDIYSKELFIARKQLILSGVYIKLHTEIAKLIKARGSNQIVLDIGSGEGSHLKQILNNCNNVSVAMMLDISKPAIELATSYLKDNILPFVADSNNLPLKDNSIDIAIDILSPLLISETLRVLKEGGIIIKIIPCQNYLKEVREVLGIHKYTKNEEVLSNIKQKLTVIDSRKLNYSVSLTQEQSDNLIKMTPLSGSMASKAGIKLPKVTIDLMIVVATK